MLYGYLIGVSSPSPCVVRVSMGVVRALYDVVSGIGRYIRVYLRPRPLVCFVLSLLRYRAGCGMSRAGLRVILRFVWVRVARCPRLVPFSVTSSGIAKVQIRPHQSGPSVDRLLSLGLAGICSHSSSSRSFFVIHSLFIRSFFVICRAVISTDYGPPPITMKRAVATKG
jgi:hypothetical protein